MIKRIMLLLTVLMVSIAVSAQRNCGTMEYLEEMKADNPLLELRMQEIESFTRNFEKSYQSHGNRLQVTIPVVVHVVYNNTTENISDAQILSQINILNADFRKLNADASLVPAAFQGLVADSEINFCLASRDPNGNPTNGILRVPTTKTSFSSNNYVKYASQGGSNAWPSSSYLNIWVCDLGSSLLGYAQFPGGSSATDGVVCNYTAFGNTGTAQSPFNKGRTATHEVGHWLNLYHIWGDDGSSCSGSDNVGDTPNQAGSNTGCPSFPRVTCSNGPNGDMFMNYMDYTNDACMYMFSAGQKTRMQALFAPGGARYSLLSSVGCQSPGGGGTTCDAPLSLSVSNVTNATATLNWAPVSGSASYNVEVKTSASSTYTAFNTASTSLSLTGFSASTSYDFRVQAVCASGTSAFSSVFTFITASAPVTCTDGFETNNTRTTSKTITLGTTIQASIGSSTDQDWFKFANTSSKRNIKVELTNLPFDYDIKLYDSRGRQVRVSENSGTTNETIVYNGAPRGTYYIQVYGYNGAFSTSSCYSLLAQIGSSSFREIDKGESNTDLEEKPDLFPSPSLTVFPTFTNGILQVLIHSPQIELSQLEVRDMTGKLILVNTSLSESMSIDISNQPAGMYFVNLVSAEAIETQKVMLIK